ncbi:MAG TPA: hypothetical protein VHM24_07705 [Gemmatimonadaceae bacterium]|nr:hypothetical protein [Gemmatimonadaceae bacterium]
MRRDVTTLATRARVFARGPAARPSVTLLFVVLLACHAGPSDPITEIEGTWGGNNAGLIAEDTVAHVHIGCTLGYAKGPIRPNADGLFETTGTYNVDAYPIDRGIIHPARFSGRVTGKTMTLTVVLRDDGRVLGPVTLTFGKEPQMGPCPICRNADLREAERQIRMLTKHRFARDLRYPF